MTLLDSAGRSTEVLWKAKALASWLHTPKIRLAMGRVCTSSQFVAFGLDLAQYLGPAEPKNVGQTEARIEGDVRHVLRDRTVRRVIAAHLVKEKGLKRGEAMAALRKMGGGG
jgi:hypothetical protein